MHRERRDSAVTRTQERIRLAAFVATTLALCAATAAQAQVKPRVDPIEPCCNIVSINGVARTATARNAVTGQLLTFAVTDKALLQGLRIGEPIYFNSRTQQVSVDYGTPCCDVVSQSVSTPVAASSVAGVTQPPSLEPPSDIHARIIAQMRSRVDPAGPCCDIVANSALNSHIGRIVVNFPAGADAGMTTSEVMKGNERAAEGWMGSGQREVAPGRYTVVIANRPVEGVVVEGGHDTQIKVGAVRVRGPEIRMSTC